MVALLACALTQSSAQKVGYLDLALNEVPEVKHATFIRELVPAGDQLFAAETRDLDGNLKFTGSYLLTDDRLIEQGEFTFYYLNGSIESRGMYDHGVKVGVWERYASNGTRRPDRFYNPESAELIRQMSNR